MAIGSLGTLRAGSQLATFGNTNRIAYTRKAIEQHSGRGQPMTTDLYGNRPTAAEPGKPRTLIFSQRNLTRILPFRCAHFEFEDVISQIDDAFVLAPRIDPSTRRQTYTKMLAYHSPLKLNPGVEPVTLPGDFDLFFAICGNPTDLL